MTDRPPAAVFLSYASQDAEAVQRIAEALRAAGVEVWFDRNELVGGDAWDQKIRGQIAACALFLPVISASTNARGEGYFRLEWKLAVDRSHLMAHDQPFLLPVVIDGTTDAAARVPPEFRAVQWTRLPLRQAQGRPVDEATEKFCTRVKTLLSGEGRDASPRRPSSESNESSGRLGETSLPKKPSRPWLVPAALGLVAVLAVAGFLVFRPKPDAGAGTRPPAVSQSNSPTAEKSAPLTEARQLIAKAWVQLNKQELARAELEAADALCKRAAELDPVDAAVWATWTHVHGWLLVHRFDVSDARKEAARDCASRALRFDPASFEVRLAQGAYAELALGGPKSAEMEALFRKLLQERPDEPRCLLIFSSYLARRVETRSEGVAMLERLAENPNYASLAWTELGWFHWNRTKDYRKADAAADRATAALPFWHNLGLKAILAAYWHGDLDLALATARRMPRSAQQEDWGMSLIDRIYEMRREPKERLKFLESVPREWIASNLFTGPKVLLTGIARLTDEAVELARRDLRRAVELIDKRMPESPNDPRLHAMKAAALRFAGDQAEAAKAYQLYLQLNRRSGFDPSSLFEPPDKVIDALEARPQLAADLRLSPWYDPLRSHPRFAALLAKAEADPNSSPKVPLPARTDEPKGAGKPAAK
ncbi:MAG: toll/interleukin-1 receptor domain-containing protein [Verrucomicrobia bacterium]|nr:toll/interleukin-1 receptor domain-containing protein [Verrucomicrobiota bacterium]